jgi:hypothetical protein
VLDAKNKNTVLKQTRAPLQQLHCFDSDDFFHSWTWHDLVTLVQTSRSWKSVDVARSFGSDVMDEKLFSHLITPNLHRLIVIPCGTISDAQLQQMVERCPDLDSLGLGSESDVGRECDVLPNTFEQLLTQVRLVSLEFGVCVHLDAEYIAVFARDALKGVVTLKVTRETMEGLLRLPPDERTWLTWFRCIPTANRPVIYPDERAFASLPVLDADVYRISVQRIDGA